MNLYGSGASEASRVVARITSATLRSHKQQGRRITALTGYDFPTARLLDLAGIDLILVGDSLGMTVLGYESTLPVTVDEVLHHTRAVARGARRALVVADMPFGSYELNQDDALRNAARLIKEGGAHAIKLEGGVCRAPLVERMVSAEIPVVGHIGLTPQAVHRMGGYRVQGRSEEAAHALCVDALALERAGVIALVLEGIPREVAAAITGQCTVPTIGIGAGPDCDGQILVFQDLVGLSGGNGQPDAPKFVRRYLDGAELFRAAVEQYRADVMEGSFPSDAESYHQPARLSETKPVTSGA